MSEANHTSGRHHKCSAGIERRIIMCAPKRHLPINAMSIVVILSISMSSSSTCCTDRHDERAAQCRPAQAAGRPERHKPATACARRRQGRGRCTRRARAEHGQLVAHSLRGNGGDQNHGRLRPVRPLVHVHVVRQPLPVHLRAQTVRRALHLRALALSTLAHLEQFGGTTGELVI